MTAPGLSLCLLILLAQDARQPAKQGPSRDTKQARGIEDFRILLEDLDRDEARELGMRCLVTRPESCAPALRAWAKDGAWWRRLVLVRVLGERGELDTATLENALADPRWPVRLAAVRVAGLPPGQLSSKDRLACLLDDEREIVRRQCLYTLARRQELDDAIFLEQWKRTGLSDDLVDIYLANPMAFGPEVLRTILIKARWAVRVLRGLPGQKLGASTPVLLAYIRGEASAGLRCLALTALPRRVWQIPVRPILQQAFAETRIRDEALIALSVQLEPAEKAWLMTDIAKEEDDDRFLLRLRMSRHVDDPGRFLASLDDCAPHRIDALVSWFERSGNKAVRVAWKTRLLKRLAASKDEELSRASMSALSPHADPTHPAIAEAFVAALKGTGSSAEIAFRSLKHASYLPARVAFARRIPERLDEHARKLLDQADRIDVGFWLELLGSENARLRWLAAQGLKGRSHHPPVRKVLLELEAKEKDEGVLSGLLRSLLHGADEETALSLTRSVLGKKIDSLDKTLITLLETARRPKLDGVLDHLDGSRLARRALLVRAYRWQVPAIRKVLLEPQTYSERELRKLRKRLARVLGKADLPLLARYLLGEGGDMAFPFVRSEIVEWLRLRRDLQADSLIERAYRSEARMEIKEGLCAALVERGRLELLKPLVDKWMLHEDEEAFGLLFEVLGALRGKVERQQCRFLMRLFLAPMIRDPLAAIRKEQNQQTLRMRIGVLYPMLQPTVERLVQAESSLIEEVLLEELRNPELRQAFAAMSKSYLLRALYVAGGYEGGIDALRPLLRLASGMVPRPHEADGAFWLLEAKVLEQAGELGAAVAASRRGMMELAVADWGPRLLEFLVNSLFRSEEGFGAGVLRARLALLEARMHASEKNLEKAREAAERAALAIAPHSFGVEEKRFLQKLALQAGETGR